MVLRGVVGDVRASFVEFVRPGESDLPGRSLWRAGRIVLTAVIVVTNVVGACAVLVLAEFVVPVPVVANARHLALVNAVAAAVYVGLAVPIGIVIGTRALFQLRDWLVDDRPPTTDEQRLVLLAPLRLFILQIALWLGASAIFGVLNGAYSGLLGTVVALTVAITGTVTAACAYLLTERILRSPAARALAGGTPDGVSVPGVATRAVLAWALGTGLPVFALAGIGTFELSGGIRATTTRLAISMVVLGGVGISVGLLAVGVAARATADPIDSVRHALGRVERGEFDWRVPVYDGTQIGQLQLGFNRMASGLAERERIREAFGTYVDADVAAHILDEGTNLEGEEVEVTIMFVDIRDFTGFAERTRAPEVVAALNRMFQRIVPVIHAHGGHVDKFIGDGLLAVFGAPRRQGLHADEALAAALEIVRTLGAGGPEFQIGIGLNSGMVVAGNVGGGGRLEFSVIGDTVNVAARVEAATRETGDTTLITDRTRELLRTPDVRLVERSVATLKGKSGPVRLFAPVTSEQ